MLEGKRPAECDYCWNVEDNSTGFSDRVFKSNESWSKPHYDEIVNSSWRTDFNPRYVEVAFSNNCNFKCSYCGPSFSSAWVQEASSPVRQRPSPASDRLPESPSARRHEHEAWVVPASRSRCSEPADRRAPD